ncbi:hypothetical protein GpartN1_g3295.t1 [Galdieria partita]|uniref:Double-strand break repair protein n=1 Tax=Galdieria partita TaxID=83374 RepID=A0A9C7PW57_9RHOD|nr:hypothetical protein GpartN1_g3295.t1 [Galdieria partita]
MSVLEDTDADFVPENVLKVLVATDIHLGYCERHPIRGDDSFHTFEEILLLARRHQVDMVLLGGDLFHENKPSRSCLVRTMRILRDYCLGEKPVALDFLSVAAEVLDSPYPVNFLDPYHSVSLPIFTIHGNHDDPIGCSGEQFSALDILQLANLINYFGKVKDAQSIQLCPLLIQKGVTKLALYGLGNIRDERLYATWHDEGKVTWLRPQVSDLSNWFHMFVFHQNRGQKGGSHIAFEELFPSFLDLVVWGHEHECKIELQGSNPCITQPGSSIATSLIEGEAVPKHVAILEIFRQQFKWTPIRLKTVRPFVMKHIRLEEEKSLENANKDQIEDFLVKYVDKLLTNTEADFYYTLKDLEDDMIIDPRLKQPLVRLRVEYTNLHTSISPQRFGQHFVGKIANSSEILKFQRKSNRKHKDVGGNASLESLQYKRDTLDELSVLGLIQKTLDTNSSLSILPVADLNSALEQFVFKSETSAIPDFVESYLAKVKKAILAKKEYLKDLNDEDIQSVCRELLQDGSDEHDIMGMDRSNLHPDEQKQSPTINPEKENASNISGASFVRMFIDDSEEEDSKGSAKEMVVSKQATKPSASVNSKRKRTNNVKKRKEETLNKTESQEESTATFSKNKRPVTNTRKSSRIATLYQGMERTSKYDFDEDDSD